MNNYNMRHKFDSFEQLRESGVYNMLDLNNVMQLSGMTEEEVMYIYRNYKDLKSIRDEVKKFEKELEELTKRNMQAEEEKTTDYDGIVKVEHTEKDGTFVLYIAGKPVVSIKL